MALRLKCCTMNRRAYFYKLKLSREPITTRLQALHGTTCWMAEFLLVETKWCKSLLRKLDVTTMPRFLDTMSISFGFWGQYCALSSLTRSCTSSRPGEGSGGASGSGRRSHCACSVHKGPHDLVSTSTYYGRPTVVFLLSKADIFCCLLKTFWKSPAMSPILEPHPQIAWHWTLRCCGGSGAVSGSPCTRGRSCRSACINTKVDEVVAVVVPDIVDSGQFVEKCKGYSLSKIVQICCWEQIQAGGMTREEEVLTCFSNRSIVERGLTDSIQVPTFLCLHIINPTITSLYASRTDLLQLSSAQQSTQTKSLNTL